MQHPKISSATATLQDIHLNVTTRCFPTHSLRSSSTIYNLLIELLRQLERLATDQDGKARGRPWVLPRAAARCSPTKATWSCPATPPPRAPSPQAPPHTPVPASHALACPAQQRDMRTVVCVIFFPW